MKILELAKFYHPHHGGIETLLRSWCEGFVRKGAEVDCVVANETGRASFEMIDGVKVHRYASFGEVLSTSISPAYLGAIRRFSPDITHSHFPNPLADAAVLLAPADAPVFLTYHSDVIRQKNIMKLYGALLNRLLARVQKIIVATPLHIEFSQWLPQFKSKCEVIPFGINLEKFAPAKQDLALQADLKKMAAGKCILLSIGRLVGYKGHAFLIEALRKLPGTQLWIIGVGPLEDKLKTQATELGVMDQVKFLGSIPDGKLSAYIYACDIFVMPSITPNEAFGLVQVEAMACGKPVVSCNLRSGVPFVNQHEKTGLLVPPSNSTALADAISRLQKNEGWRIELGQNARNRAVSEFEESVMVDRYWQCFTDT